MELEYLLNKERRELPSYDCKSGGDLHQMKERERYTCPSHYLEIQGTKVVYFWTEDADGSNKSFVVPGIVMGQEYQTKKGIPAVKVKPLNDETMQDLICKKLKIDRRYVSFWDNGKATRRVLAECHKSK